MHNNSIEKPGKLRDQFATFGDVPSSDVWKNIVVEINPKKKKRRFLWIFFLLIGVTTFGAFLLLKSTNTKEFKVQNKQIINSFTSKLTSKNHKNYQKTNNSSSIKPNSNHTIWTTDNSIKSNFSPTSNLLNENHNLRDFNRNLQVFESDPKVKIDEFQSELNLKTNHTVSLSFDSIILVNRISNVGFISNHFQNLELISMVPFKKLESTADFSFSILGGMNYRVAKFSDTRNYYQLSFSFLAKYRFKNNFAIETGLVILKNRRDDLILSGLSNQSLFPSSSDLMFRFDDLILALPIKASFQLYQKNKFQAELFGGFQFQHMTKNRDVAYGSNPPTNGFMYSISNANYNYTADNNNFSSKFNVMSQIGFNLYFQSSKFFKYRISPFYQYYTKKCERFSFVTQGTKHWVGFQLGIEF